MAFYAVCLLGGLGLGLKAGVRELFVCTAVLLVATFAGSLYLGDPLWTAILRSIATAVLVQVGFFAALLLRSVTHGPEHENGAIGSNRQCRERPGGGSGDTILRPPQPPAADRQEDARRVDVSQNPEK